MLTLIFCYFLQTTRIQLNVNIEEPLSQTFLVVSFLKLLNLLQLFLEVSLNISSNFTTTVAIEYSEHSLIGCKVEI